MEYTAAKHRTAAYVVGTLTLAMLVTFIALDLQAMRREAARPPIVATHLFVATE
jgi:hypothetical protein